MNRKQFLSKLTSKNYYIRVIKIRKLYEDQRKDYYNYSLKQEKLINRLNNYFENLNWHSTPIRYNIV